MFLRTEKCFFQSPFKTEIVEGMEWVILLKLWSVFMSQHKSPLTELFLHGAGVGKEVVPGRKQSAVSQGFCFHPSAPFPTWQPEARLRCDTSGLFWFLGLCRERCSWASGRNSSL